MTKREIPQTKECKHCKTEIPYGAKVCPNCGKKQNGGALKWVIIGIVVIIIVAAVAGGGGNDDSVTKVGEVSQDSSNVSDESNVTDDSLSSEKTEFYVGDIIQDGDMQIVYAASGVYTEDNEFLQPDEGYQYIFIKLSCTNTGDSGDESITYFSFECYADGYSVDQYYSGDNALSATLSPNRSTTGYVYFMVPEDAEQIEIEYETNYWTDEKIKFIYEGEKDSGYSVTANTNRNDEAFSVEDIVTTSDYIIMYISCERWESDSDYIQPTDGYYFISLEFEVENTSDSDFYISSYSFYCYADGISCDRSYYRDDNLSATLSSGRKTKGTVTFEVPIDATVIEVEYETNVWTSSRIVFTAK
ncbi:MAG: DUF4352 domain-containing protein [Firmicutes bacterium]|nr:DUF4352 domain-containing protein [Bacillota bacterium]